MSKRHGPVPSRTPAVQRADTGEALARLLAAPNLSRVVPLLAPEMLHQVIRHSGLDACGELVAAATPAQLARVFDLDLWRSPQVGKDERFDPDRFGEWLELLVETGIPFAARTVAAMDQDLVIAGLSSRIRVFDFGTFEPTAATDDEPIDTRPSGSDGFECELAGYFVRAHDTAAWDAIVTVLTALATDHPDYFDAVMHGCRRLSNSAPEVDGLDDLLGEPQQQMYDLTVDREQRRAQQGYSTPADARAFLQMARTRGREPRDASTTNPVVAAYFRAVHDATPAMEHEAAGAVESAADSSPATADIHAALDGIVDLLIEAGLMPQRPRALLEAAGPQQSTLLTIRRLMDYLADRDAAAYLTREQELAFLANALVAGCSVQSRSFTPQEASQAAVAVCNLGLEQWPALPESFLVNHGLVDAFEVGWSVLHEDVSLFAAGQLLAAVTGLRSVDSDVRDGLQALRRTLRTQREAGTPWRARDALEVLALLDMPVWVSLLGLLDECPILPAALVATVEARTKPVSPTAFEFISTTTQIEMIQLFMSRLPEMLRR
jgi:hypothetical protein